MVRDRAKKYRLICHISMVLLILSMGVNGVGAAYLVRSAEAVLEVSSTEVVEGATTFTEESL
ncbi:MAG: hypothetical protein RR490_03535, partial [Niameybacter sp.]